MRQSIEFSLSIEISILPIIFQVISNNFIFLAATIPFSARHGCRTPSATTLFLSIEIYYVHQFLLDIANVSFLVVNNIRFKKIIYYVIRVCTEHAGKKHTRIYSSFYFLFFFLFRFYAYLTHIAYTHEYTYTCTYTREDTTQLEYSTSDLTSLYRRLSQHQTIPATNEKFLSSPPLSSPPFIRSFRFFLSFLFFFLTNRGSNKGGMGPECTRGRSDSKPNNDLDDI